MSRMTGRPGTGLGAGPRGGMAAGCWLPPAAAMAAGPAWRAASASSLLKNTKICIIANYSTVKLLKYVCPCAVNVVGQYEKKILSYTKCVHFKVSNGPIF